MNCWKCGQPAEWVFLGVRLGLGLLVQVEFWSCNACAPCDVPEREEAPQARP